MVLREVDTLISRGVDYIYWIDEIFGVGKTVRRLLQELSRRSITIGLQTRIDLWDEESLDLLGAARCISMECGIESITAEGREGLNKNCRIGTDRQPPHLRQGRCEEVWRARRLDHRCGRIPVERPLGRRLPYRLGARRQYRPGGEAAPAAGDQPYLRRAGPRYSLCHDG